MVTFGENLKTWKDASHLSVESLAKKTGIDSFRIRLLLADKENPTVEETEKLSKTFSVPVLTFIRGVNVTMDTQNKNEKSNPLSLNANDEYRKIIDKYLACPTEYRKQISKLLCAKITSTTRITGMKLEQRLGLANTTFSKSRLLKSALSEQYIIKMATSLEKEQLMEQEQFYDALKNYLNRFIGNYNLSVAQKAYGFSAVRFSKACHVSEATVSQLLAYKYSTSDEFLAKACSILNTDAKTFKTILLSEKDFDCKNVLNDINKEAKQVDKGKENDKKAHLMPKVQKAAKIEESPIERKDEKNQNDKFYEALSISEQEVLGKMYSKLTPVHKTDVLNQIKQYFWEDIG